MRRQAPEPQDACAAPAPGPLDDSYPKRLAILGLGLASAALLAIGLDCHVARCVAAHPLHGDLRRFVALTECFGYGLTVALIVLTAGVLDPRGWAAAWRLAVFAFTPALLANVLKALVSRQRPPVADLTGHAIATFGWSNITIDRYISGGYPMQSFPSGHTATAVGLAIGLTCLYPRGGWLFACYALLAGWQRIAASAHFPSDVLAGAALSCFCAAALLARYPRVGQLANSPEA